jgi:hypothetical protein
MTKYWSECKDGDGYEPPKSAEPFWTAGRFAALLLVLGAFRVAGIPELFRGGVWFGNGVEGISDCGRIHRCGHGHGNLFTQAKP